MPKEEIIGYPPSNNACEICAKPFRLLAVDGKTKLGPWAWMCAKCADEFGVGLGAGRGRIYQRTQKDGQEQWVKVGG